VSDTIRIANCSGFYGDRLSAAREMVEGGPIDVLTGDYLAELTMLILLRSKMKDPSKGYASTFLKQCEQILASCAEKGIKVVVNAGGLNPSGCAEAVREICQQLGLGLRVAHIEGDDLMPRVQELANTYGLANLDTGQGLAEANVHPVSANAYLGGAGIAEALRAGADVVITGRVTDAALVVGPSMWKFNWQPNDIDQIASAIVAGHIIECGAHATGGNYSFFKEIPDLKNPGFPLVEMSSDGTFVVTKHPGTAGQVDVGTVTAQLLYEIAGPRYINPDAVARFDSIQIEQQAENHVRVSGVRGELPPTHLKVCINYLGGFRNRMEMVLTGLDIDEKADLALSVLDLTKFRNAETRLIRSDQPDAPTNEQAVAVLRVEVKDSDPKLVGRAFSSAVTELALASYPGFTMTSPPGDGSPYGVYWPCLVPREEVTEEVVLWDGQRIKINSPTDVAIPEIDEPAPADGGMDSGEVARAPLGVILGARSGDKGGNANLGVWARSDAAFAWVRRWLSVPRLRTLLGPEVTNLEIERFELPNLRSINFVIRGLLGEGVSSSSRPDPQAKGLGEYLRSRYAEIPRDLLIEAGYSSSD
jgi:hypothetical protein